VAVELFAALDEDKSGSINYNELFERVHRDNFGEKLAWLKGFSKTERAQRKATARTTSSSASSSPTPFPEGGFKLRQKKSATTKQVVMALAWNDYETSLGRECGFSGLVDTTGWQWKAEDADGLAAELRDRLSSSGQSVADLMEIFRADKRGLDKLDDDVTEQQFFLGMTARLGYARGVEPLRQVFERVDTDGSGRVSFDELFAFLVGRQNRLTRRQLDARKLQELSLSKLARRDTWRRPKVGTGAPQPHQQPLHAQQQQQQPQPLESVVEAGEEWSMEDMRKALHAMLSEHSITPQQLVEAWDKDGGGTLNKREILSQMKKLFVGDSMDVEGIALWDTKIRATVLKVFAMLSGDDGGVDGVEFHNWLEHGTSEPTVSMDGDPRTPSALGPGAAAATPAASVAARASRPAKAAEPATVAEQRRRKPVWRSAPVPTPKAGGCCSASTHPRPSSASSLSQSVAKLERLFWDGPMVGWDSSSSSSMRTSSSRAATKSTSALAGQLRYPHGYPQAPRLGFDSLVPPVGVALGRPPSTFEGTSMHTIRVGVRSAMIHLDDLRLDGVQESLRRLRDHVSRASEI
jgi:Ca2+-binding EF-hand superfamily protein